MGIQHLLWLGTVGAKLGKTFKSPCPSGIHSLVNKDTDLGKEMVFQLVEKIHKVEFGGKGAQTLNSTKKEELMNG